MPVIFGMKRTLMLLSLAAMTAGHATAQDYPTRPITLVVPYAAGGGNDIMARTAGDKMSPLLGQQIVIENRGGAGGSIATRQVAKSAPDGYTLGLGGTGTLAIDPTLYPNAGYDPRKDFAPIGLIGTSALVLVIHPSIPAHSVKELIAYAKANPGKLTFASAGVGSGIHLAAEYFRFQAGIEMTHVPTRARRRRSAIWSAATSRCTSARCRRQSRWSRTASSARSP
jgi:tripartite-type tricarboxylate transporter receptor subunit TctC